MKCPSITPFLAPLVAASVHAQEPPDTPTEIDTRGLVRSEPGAFEGYTMIAPLAGEQGVVFLLDMEGEVVHEWVTSTTTEQGILRENGNLLRWGIVVADIGSWPEDSRFQGGGVMGGLIEEVDWYGDPVWRYELFNDRQLLHHDIALLPNGNVLILAWEHHETAEAIAAGRDPERVGDAGMWPDSIYEIRPTPPEGGEIVWKWHVWDHLIQDFDATKENYGSVPDHPGRVDINADHRGRPPLTPEEIAEREELERQMAALGYGGEDDDAEEVASSPGTAPDWLHTNAIDYLPEYELIVLSIPTLNELWVIDHSTTTAEAASDSGGRWERGGELLWRWGNPRTYGAGEDTDQRLSFQHDPTWIPGAKPGELRLLVFNNGRERHGGGESHSSVDELVLPFDLEKGFLRETGAAFGPEEPVWSYADPGTFYSSFISGAERLPNGNTLICSGAQGRVFEITPAGEVVWDYRNPFTSTVDDGIPANSLYRAYRIPKDHPGLAGRDL